MSGVSLVISGIELWTGIMLVLTIKRYMVECMLFAGDGKIVVGWGGNFLEVR